MKEKIKTLYSEHKKYFWIGGVVIVIALYFVFSSGSKSTINVFKVAHTDLKQTILATGQVTSATDLNLSFPTSGVVATLPVSVGDKVWQGQVLATLSNRSQYAALADAKANYQKVIDGNSNEQVAVAQTALDSAKASLDNIQKTQDTLLANAHLALMNVDLTPTLTQGTSGTAPTVTGTYTGNDSGTYVVTPYPTGNGGYMSWSGIENGNATISTSVPVALGTHGLFIQFPVNFNSVSGNVWTITLPNTKSSNYVAVYNAYQSAQKNHDSAISAAQAHVNEAQANLDLQKAKAQPADIAVAQAKVDQAQAAYDNTIIYAPSNGTIVHVDTKIGESVDPKTETIVLQDIANLYVEANVNETSIAKVAIKQPVSMTLDAFGLDTTFTGQVIHIDPSSTTNNGIVNFVIKTSIVDPVCNDTNDCDATKNIVRPGMNANMVITAWDHPNVIAIPKVAITTKADGSYVNIVIDDKNGKYESRKITTGNLGDGNLIEVTSGLKDGEEIAIIQ